MCMVYSYGGDATNTGMTDEEFPHIQRRGSPFKRRTATIPITQTRLDVQARASSVHDGVMIWTDNFFQLYFSMERLNPDPGHLAAERRQERTNRQPPNPELSTTTRKHGRFSISF